MDTDMEYDDIIDLPAPEPRNHPRMPMQKRAAQFAPFSALSGYSEALRKATEEHIRNCK